MFQKSKPQANEQQSNAHLGPRHAEAERSAPSCEGDRRIACIGAATQLKGQIEGDEDLRIDGRVLGDVACREHTVTIGKQGYIEGDVIARLLLVAGTVKGRLIAAEKITIHEGAEIEGEIHTPSLELENGAIFHGNIDMAPDQALLQESFANHTPPALDVHRAALSAQAATAPSELLAHPGDADLEEDDARR